MHHSNSTFLSSHLDLSQESANDSRWSHGRSSGKRLASVASCMDPAVSTSSPDNDVIDFRGSPAAPAVSAAPSLPLSVGGASGIMMHAHGQSAATVAAACCCAAAANLKAGPAVTSNAPTPKRQRVRDSTATTDCRSANGKELSDELSASEGTSGWTALPTKKNVCSSPLRAEMFLDFVDSSSLIMLPSREKAEALLQQHRQRLLAAREQQRGGGCGRLRPLERPPFAFVPTGCRNRSGSTPSSLVANADRDSSRMKGIGNGELSLDEKTLTTLETGLRARENLYRLRQQVLELPRPNRHGVALVYGARMSADDGYDYRVIYWGEVSGTTKEEKEVHRRRAQAFRGLIRSLAAKSPDRHLTVQQLVMDLDINMSKGWVHFARLTLPGKPDPYSEFLLRRKRDEPHEGLKPITSGSS